jgi:hypothetical protein
LKVNAWVVAGGLLLAYALWRAYGPRPDLAADTVAASAADDETITTGPLQAFSNAFGALALAGGFNDVAGFDPSEDDTGDGSDQFLGDPNGDF